MFKRYKKNKMNKKGLELEMLGWWLIALAVLVVVILGIFILRGKGEAAITFIRDLFRFGR
jgi:hypothetical protein